jgi:hypothetical protein
MWYLSLIFCTSVYNDTHCAANRKQFSWFEEEHHDSHDYVCQVELCCATEIYLSDAVETHNFLVLDQFTCVQFDQYIE